MTRRYYCEYCDKTFIDELQARKKHLQSTHHMKRRYLHYEKYRDPKELLKEESSKFICRRYFQDRTCPFGSLCKYRHYSDKQLWKIKKAVEGADLIDKQAEYIVPVIPSIESWLQKYNEKNTDNNDAARIFWTYPENLEKRTDLPPSLWKFKPEHFEYDTFDEWGK